MNLEADEYQVKTIRRHLTPFIIKMVQLAVVVMPIYIVLFYLWIEFRGALLIWVIGIFSFFVGVVITIIVLDYLLDKLMITNRRIIWINWKSLFHRQENETELMDIQDVKTFQRGILAKIRFFDYGLLEIESAASHAVISFEDCPHPSEVRHFLIERAQACRIAEKNRDAK